MLQAATCEVAIWQPNSLFGRQRTDIQDSLPCHKVLLKLGIAWNSEFSRFLQLTISAGAARSD